MKFAKYERRPYLFCLRNIGWLGYGLSGLDWRQITSLRHTALVKSLAVFCLVVISFALNVSHAFAASAPAMLTPGQFNVTASGAFTYNIPIAVPPGTGGMVPALSLDYSSQSGDGEVGLGWALSGLPSIDRCPRTLAEDAVHGSVNYDMSDRYCMEGQRLVLVSGTYGAANSQYRTEVEGFSKIVAFGTAGNGPAYFKVWTKAGQVMEFGNTADSQVLAVGKTTARSWAVNKITDTKGNYLAVTYNSATGADRTANGEAYPIQIDYTGNTTSIPVLSTYNKVTFTYAARSDVASSYQAGSVQKSTVLLSDIKTYAGAVLIADYKLAYSPASSGASHDELQSITQCDGTTPTQICLKPTTFGWQGSRDALTVTAVPNSLAQKISATVTLQGGNYVGDGLTDAFVQSTDGNCQIYAGTQAGTFVSSGITAQYTYFEKDGTQWVPVGYNSLACFVNADIPTRMAFHPFDMNGDGLTDAMIAVRTGAASHDILWLINHLGSLIDTYGQVSYGGRQYGDFNGDGLDDILTPQSSGGLDQVQLSNGIYFLPALSPSYTSVNGLLDFDGNGCTDIITGTTGPLVVNLFCGPAVSTVTLPTWSAGNVRIFGDFNGDGKTDILVVYQAAAGVLYLSSGTGVVTSSFAVPSDWGKYAIYTGDWNGDGKTDIALVAPGATGYYGVGTSHKIFLSNGNGFTQIATISNTNAADTTVTAVVADWNNDGAADLWIKKPSGDTEYLFSYVPELMTTVNNGLGIATTVTYDRLNKNGTLYQKCANGTYECGDAYPTQDVDAPLYVVSRIDSSNGLGSCAPPALTNCYSSSYSYAAAQVDLSGRGFSGFQKVIVTDLQTGVVQITQYRLDFPFTGLIASQTKMLGAVTLNSASNVFEEVSLGTGLDNVKRWFVGLHQTIVSSNDYDGTTTYAMPTLTTSYVYDCDTGTPSICSGTSPTGFGNSTQITAAETYSSDNSTKVTTNTFDNDSTNWFLGRLHTANVQSTVNAIPVLTRHTSYTYDSASGLLTSEIVEPGAADPTLTLETDYAYDAFGNKTTATGKGCVWISSTQCTIDAVGNPTSVRTTTTAFDIATYHGSFPTTATNAKSQTETWGYDLRFGAPATHSGPNGLTTNWTYDTFGRKILETRPDGNKTSISYTYCTGLPSGESCPTGAQFDVIVTPQNSSGTQNGPITITYFDGLSRVVAADVEGYDGPGTTCTLAAPCWVRTATQYDTYGRISQTSRAYFLSGGTAKWNVNTYDILGRVQQTTFPDTSKVTFGFAGLTTTTTNNKSQVTTTVRNAQGQIASVTDANSNTTTYAYDAFGNQLTITDPATPTHHVITNTYDLRGRKLTSTDPDMGSWSYVYDGFGELYKQTDAKSQVSTLTYDALGRVLTRVEVGLTSTWTYDTASGKGIGQLATATTGSAYARTLTYDTLARPLSTQLTVDGTPQAYTSSYDSNGRVASVNYPSGLIVQYIYTATGYLCRMTDNGGTATCSSGGGSQIFWTANTRDAEMHLTEAIAGNGIITSQAFDPNTGLVQSIEAGPTGNPSSVANFVYQFDTLGNLTSRQDVIENYTERFCYDVLNRLTNYAIGAACTSSGTKTVGYDLLGSITSKTGVGTYNYSSSGAGPHAVTSITGTVNGVVNPVFTYDANGNQLCEYALSGGDCTTAASRLITWTSFNLAAQITQGATVINLTYDSEHARIKQVIGSATTYYLNDPSSGAMSEKSISGATTTWSDYLLADGKIVALRTAVVGGGTTLSYFVLDHLGSIAVITDASGAVVTGGRLSYDAWGRRRNADGTDAPSCVATSAITTRGFTNQEQMDGICAVNLNARIYDPTVGKFLSADPVIGTQFDLQQLNRYAYVTNNPLSLVDPSGLCFLGCFWKNAIFRDIIAIAVVIVFQQYELLPEIGGALGFTTASATFATVVNGAILGGIAGGIATGTLKGALISAGAGAAFAGLAPALGSSLGDTLSSVLGPQIAPIAGRFIASGLIGGLSSVAQGSNFGSGFLAGGVGSLAGPLPGGGGITPQGVLVSAVLGGAASVLGGGKFANGAITGAFAYAAGSLAERGNTMGGAEEGPDTGNGTGAGPRVLTQGEIDIAKTEFPDINTDPLRITYDESGDAAYTPNDTMHFPESVSDCMDFSSCNGGRFTGWFVHELTHTWQYQNGVSPFWGHIFSSDLFKFGGYLSKQEYYQTPNPANLSTEQQGDWHMWHYLCTNRPSC